jgi:lipopolysaccharide/colanic/teichoic acid biosynthesis glycosyltransferase
VDIDACEGPGGHPADHGRWRDVVDDDRATADHRSVADRHAHHHHGSRPDEDVIADRHGSPVDGRVFPPAHTAARRGVGVDLRARGDVAAPADSQPARAVDDRERANPGSLTDLGFPDDPGTRIVGTLNGSTWLSTAARVTHSLPFASQAARPYQRGFVAGLAELTAGNVSGMLARERGRRPALPLRPRQRAVKRVADVVGAAALLLLLTPLLVGVAALLLVASGRPVLFLQTRVGWNGAVIRIWKFRTMVRGADALRDAVWADGAQEGKAAPPPMFKRRDDPRVTRVGRALRRFSIDELPQLWNVLRGEMSLVGPRPLPVIDHQRAAGVPGIDDRLVVRPGITGPWQIRGRSDLGVEAMLALDLDYITGWTFARDLWLLAATVPAVLRGRGAY